MPKTIKAIIGEKSIPIPPMFAIGKILLNKPKNGSVTSYMNPTTELRPGLSGSGIHDMMIRASNNHM
jgi:hypothetical protein